VLHRLDEITADLTQRFGGTVVNSTGDGHLITFRRLFWSHSSPARGSTITVAATYSVVRPVMLLASRVECSVCSLLTQGYRHPMAIVADLVFAGQAWHKVDGYRTGI
jgi:hypothetical protein